MSESKFRTHSWRSLPPAATKARRRPSGESATHAEPIESHIRMAARR